jgi:hypothetical protein
MIATITPAGCGSRHRHLIAAASFTGGAVAAAALLGTLAGLAGSVLGAGRWPLAAALLAVLAAAREVGLLDVAVPQSRRQVPERWRRELPLPLWSAGYGAGLGVGLATFQPVATFWIALAGALVIADPATSAACLAVYGVARALLAVAPGWRGGDGDALLGAGRHLRRVNALGLLGCAVLLGVAGEGSARAGVLPLGRGSQLDPSLSGGVLAYVQRSGGRSEVVVRAPGEPPRRFPAASQPSLAGGLLAVHDASGIRVLRWRDGSEVGRIPGAVRYPASDGQRLAFLQHTRRGWRLVDVDLASGGYHVVAYAPRGGTLSRPALARGHLAWVVSGPSGSALHVAEADGSHDEVLVRTRIDLLGAPALGTGEVAYSIENATGSQVVVRWLGRSSRSRVALSLRAPFGVWSTTLVGRTAIVTRWSQRTDQARLVRSRF